MTTEKTTYEKVFMGIVGSLFVFGLVLLFFVMLYLAFNPDIIVKEVKHEDTSNSVIDATDCRLRRLQ